MEILHASAECYPVAKVGGLADVVGALPKYLNRLGSIAKVVMPKYSNKFFAQNEWEVTHEGNLHLGSQWLHYSIIKEKTNKLGFDLYAVEIPDLLKEELPYGYPNDTERHVGFQVAVLDWVNHWNHLPDIIHCHDHHTGLIPFMMKFCFEYERLKEIPSVFTIHNGNYQGWIGWNKEFLIPKYDAWKRGMLEWADCINSLACAIKCSWQFTTVSPGYLEELSNDALGLESLIRTERKKAIGILNGIDAEVWDPEKDPMIEKNYSRKKADKGKRKNKEALCNAFQLDETKPLFAFIGRLVPDKGADLLAPAISHAVNISDAELSFIVLGSGMNDYEDTLNGLKKNLPDNFNCFIGYHEKLSHLIYAGADFLLMPSRTEPCGLNQMYALRYGTIPIVRSTGGLKDTVIDIGEKHGFGFRFEQATVKDLTDSIRRAHLLARDEELLTSVRERIMKIDHSWDHSAKEYLKLYTSVTTTDKKL